MQDIQVQLDALIQLRSFLMRFNEDIREKSVEFNARFRALRDAGLSAQISENYEANYADPNLQHLRYLIANITDRDIPYVSVLIAQFEETLAKARM